MDEKEYSVSEAVRLIGVESHVLRYWEEELGIMIRRTSQGHRIYSQENVDTFCQVKQLKEKGIQLKAIRVLLSEIEKEALEESGDGVNTLNSWQSAEKSGSQAGIERVDGMDLHTGLEMSDISGASEILDMEVYSDASEAYPVPAKTEKPERLQQFEQILKQMIEEVVREQNEKLECAITERMREELEQLYLQYEQAMQEAAAASVNSGSRQGENGFINRIRRWMCRDS